MTVPRSDKWVDRGILGVSMTRLEDVSRQLRGIPGAAERAIAKALTHGARTAQSEAVSEIVGTYTVERDEVAATMMVRKAYPNLLEAEVKSRDRGLSLDAFPHAPTTAGTGGRGRPVLRAEIKRGAMTPVPGAFVGTFGGVPKIAWRTTKARAPLQIVPSIPIPVMLGTKSVSEYVLDHGIAAAADRLPVEIAEELGRAGRAGRGGGRR